MEMNVDKMIIKIHVNSAETYRAYRAAWKTMYREVTEKIRELQITKKTGQREFSKIERGLERDRWGYLKTTHEYRVAWSKMDKSTSEKEKASRLARVMCGELDHVKSLRPVKEAEVTVGTSAI